MTTEEINHIIAEILSEPHHSSRQRREEMLTVLLCEARSDAGKIARAESMRVREHLVADLRARVAELEEQKEGFMEINYKLHMENARLQAAVGIHPELSQKLTMLCDSPETAALREAVKDAAQKAIEDLRYANPYDPTNKRDSEPTL